MFFLTSTNLTSKPTHLTFPHPNARDIHHNTTQNWIWQDLRQCLIPGSTLANGSEHNGAWKWSVSGGVVLMLNHLLLCGPTCRGSVVYNPQYGDQVHVRGNPKKRGCFSRLLCYHRRGSQAQHSFCQGMLLNLQIHICCWSIWLIDFELHCWLLLLLFDLLWKFMLVIFVYEIMFSVQSINWLCMGKIYRKPHWAFLVWFPSQSHYFHP